MHKKLDPRVRKDTILSAAMAVAHDRKTVAITRSEVAKAAGVSEGSVNAHFSTMHQLRTALVKRAFTDRDVPVLAYATRSDKYRIQLPPALKQMVLDHIAAEL